MTKKAKTFFVEKRRNLNLEFASKCTNNSPIILHQVFFDNTLRSNFLGKNLCAATAYSYSQKKHHLITINLKYSMQGEHVFNQPQSSIVWYFFLCQKNILWSPLFENISCKTSCFLITRNHRLLIFGQKRSVITIGEKYFMQNVLFLSLTIIDCVLFFLCEKKRPSFTTFERYFTSCKSVNDHLLFVFFSRHFTFYSDRLKVLSNLKNEKIFADIECEVWTMTFKMAFLYSCHQFRKMREKSPFSKSSRVFPV